jgi:hypothetical protein
MLPKDKMKQSLLNGFTFYAKLLPQIGKSKILAFTCLTFFLLQPYHFKAQEKNYLQTVRGTVFDAGSHSPIPGANVFIQGTTARYAQITDKDGEFAFKAIPLGRYDLSVEVLGYKPSAVPNLVVRSGKEIVLEIALEEMVVQLQEIEIRGGVSKEKPLNEMAQISARSFTVDETERYAGTWLDPARMATNFAGVMTAGDQRNDIIIRGNSPLGLLWRLEGIDIPNPNHFGTLGTTGGPISILNNNLLTNSDFFTSAFPAEYGNAISGVFDLNLRNGNNQKHEFVAQIGMNGIETGAEGPFSKKHKSSFLLNYRYSTLKIFDAVGISFGVSGVPQYHDYSFKINLPGTKAGRFTLFGIGGNSFIEILEKNKKSSDWSFGRNGLDLRLSSAMNATGISHLYFFSENTRIKTHLAISKANIHAKADSAFLNAPTINSYADKSTEIKYTISSKFSHKISAKNNYSLGLVFDVFSVLYVDSMLMPDYSYRQLTNANGYSTFFQAFAQWQHKFTDNLSCYSGLHYQYFNLNSAKALEPRWSIKYTIFSRHTFSAGIGFHSQLQPRLFYFLQTKLPDGSYQTTNINLGFSKSRQFVLGYDFLLSKNLRLKFESYYQFLHQIPVEKRPSYYSIINYGAEFYSQRADSLINDGVGRNYGIELTLEKFLSKNYYFLCTTSIFESIYKGSDNITRNTAHNGKYVINFLTGYTFRIRKYNALSFDFKLVNSGGRHYIPVDLELSKSAGAKVLDYENAYMNQYPAYFRIDGRTSFKLNRKKFNMEMAFDVQNLTKHENILLETYDVSSASVKYDYQLGLFYVFLLRFQF